MNDLYLLAAGAVLVVTGLVVMVNAIGALVVSGWRVARRLRVKKRR